MKKFIGALLVGGVIVGVLMALGKKMADTDSATFFAKMQAKMEEMPEDFPPRVMFDNVAKTRENTDRILEILETGDVEEPKAVAS